MKIDITSILEDELCKTIVYEGQKAKNIAFNYKTTNGIMYVYNRIYSSGLKPKYKLLQKIEVVHQKTGFGYKKLFKCPYCGKRRKYMYFVSDTDKLACRECIGCNIYAYRTNLYDGNIENVIKYKILMLLYDLKADIKSGNMLNLLSNIPDKPKYMRWSKYEIKCKQLYFLYHIYWGVVNETIDRFKPKELKDMLQEDNVNFAYENIIAPTYFRKILREVN